VSLFDNWATSCFFGRLRYRGELGNVQRVVPRDDELLWWDTRDRYGQAAGQGVYVWKVVFRFQTASRNPIRRTGLMRSGKN